MIIVGLDVCASSVVACALSEKPDRPLNWFRSNRSTIPTMQANKEGIEQLLLMKPDYAVLEPTGINYSRLWANWLIEASIPLLWVGHAQLKSHRIELKLPNKNDAADAFALAHFAFVHLNDPDYFLSFEINGLGATVRMLGLQLQHLNRVSSPIVNRFRQNLAHEWPEVMNRKLSKTAANNGPALLRFVCGLEISKRSQTILNKSLNSTVGSGISDFTREHAKRLLNLENQQIDIERALLEIVNSEPFEMYNRVFDRFAFGKRIRSIILSYCYPFESFLNQNGNEIRDKVVSRTGKKGTRYRSLASFKLSLGYGLVEDTSGKSSAWIPGGSKICRIALWQWVFSRIEVRKNRPENEPCASLGAKLDAMKDGGVPAPVARSRIASRTVELLFYELLKEWKAKKSKERAGNLE